ncbi:MAG: transcription termination/antitermination protein NusA [Dehalococcoidia bacterium]|nr:transcription termination/antitermination protein NusA [Dehalococcoidia bacterium]
MKNDFLIAITQLSAEKNLPKEVVLEAVEAALASAFKREANETGPNITVKVNPTSGEVLVYTMKTVVETVEDAKIELTLGEAQVFDKKAQIGHTVAIETMVKNAGRIAAQTAKQVVMQRLREAEREVVFAEFVGREGDIVSGIIQRIEPKQIIIDLGKTEAILPSAEQIRTEHYRPGQRLKVYLHEVFRSGRGPQVVVSRTHRNLVRRLFELEVPEIFNGTVEIKSIAREPGFRSKVAVAARQEGVDAVGACVGLRGIRIQNIINELSGEKIDVIEWHPDASVFVANALSPAPVVSVRVNEDEKTAAVVVPDRQLSLAIGREGQNARLAAKLTGWRIDIKSASAAEADRLVWAEEEAVRAAEAALLAPPVAEEPTPEPVAEPLAPAARVGGAVPAATAGTWALPTAPAPAAVTVAAPPAPAAAPALAGIRFAEEIFPAAAPIVIGGKPEKKGKGKKTRDEEGVAAAAKVKKAKRSSGRPVYEVEEEDDELEEYSELIRVPRR